MKPYVAMIRTDEDDRELTESIIAETGINISLRFVADPVDLFTLIRSEGTPSLILLNDRGTAHKGYDHLRTIRADPSSNHIPVIILGEVSTEDYIRECYRAGANSFVTKPSTVAETKKKISLFFDYWLHVAEC